MVDLARAYASCARDARRHYENFPVASMLLPPAMRPHVAAVYAFSRAADDFADEGERPDAERLHLLDGWLARLQDAVSWPDGSPAPPDDGEPANTREIFTALGATMRARHLPRALFEDLLSAFRQDVTVTRYATWDELLDYCRRSANPVGRLVLRIAGHHDDAELDGWSDAICTALQLTNFWQDLKVDFDRGRIYLPGELLRAHGADERSLGAGRLAPEWKAALAEAAARTRALFAGGRPLCDAMRGRLRWELRATWLGGTRILDRLERTGWDVLARRPTLGAADLPALAAGTLIWAGGRGRLPRGAES
jgi:squalene synthase HpnC